MKRIPQSVVVITFTFFLSSYNNTVDASSRALTAVHSPEKNLDTSRISFPPVKKLVLSFCDRPIRIVSDTMFSFPKNLKELGLEVEKDGDAYVLKNTADTTPPVVSNNTLAVGPRNSEPVIITVPDGTDLDASLLNDLAVTARIASLDVDILGSADVCIESSENVGSIDISGSGNVVIKKTGAIKNLHVSGSGGITIRKCSTVGKVSVSGSGDIDLPYGARLRSFSVSDSGKVY